MRILPLPCNYSYLLFFIGSGEALRLSWNGPFPAFRRKLGHAEDLSVVCDLFVALVWNIVDFLLKPTSRQTSVVYRHNFIRRFQEKFCFSAHILHCHNSTIQETIERFILSWNAISTMKLLTTSVVFILGAMSGAYAQCEETKEIMIEENTKMSFAGFQPNVKR
jgi:hypothetical protein